MIIDNEDAQIETNIIDHIDNLSTDLIINNTKSIDGRPDIWHRSGNRRDIIEIFFVNSRILYNNSLSICINRYE